MTGIRHPRSSVSLAPYLTSENSRAPTSVTAAGAPCGASRFGAWSAACDAPTGHRPPAFPQGREKYPACRVGSRGYLTCLHVREAAQSLPLHRAVRPNATTIHVHYSGPVVLLVQPSRDDGLEMYTDNTTLFSKSEQRDRGEGRGSTQGCCEVARAAESVLRQGTREPVARGGMSQHSGSVIKES
jgi:hypothetical protein